MVVVWVVVVEVVEVEDGAANEVVVQGIDLGFVARRRVAVAVYSIV